MFYFFDCHFLLGPETTFSVPVSTPFPVILYYILYIICFIDDDDNDDDDDDDVLNYRSIY